METLEKKSDTIPGYLQAAGIGVLAGMRSMSALAVAGEKLSSSGASLPAPLNLFASRPVAGALKFLAASEMAADKYSKMPDRTAPVGLIGRALSGAVAGAALCAARKCNVGLGAVIAGATAVAATYGSFYLRKKMGHDFKIPDKVVGAIEDALTVGSGYGLLKATGGAGAKGLIQKLL
jgi:uncharacterized membrane protein